MIVFETELGRLVDLLPQHTDARGTEFPIKYGWGSAEDLGQYIEKSGVNAFPLIWLELGRDTHNLRGATNTVKRNAKINIVSIAQMPEQFNPYQYQYDFKEVLQPIADNLISALTQSGISMVDLGNLNATKVTKFSMKQIDATLAYICNAIVLECEITFSNVTNCLNKIHFN
jgi:hypothetical protein